MNMEGADASTSTSVPAPVTPLSLPPFIESAGASTLAPGPATAEEENSRYQATSELFPFPLFPRSIWRVASGDASTSVSVPAAAAAPVIAEEENTRYQDIINNIPLALPKISKYSPSTSQLLPLLFASGDATTSVRVPAPAPAEENTRYQDIINNIHLQPPKISKYNQSTSQFLPLLFQSCDASTSVRVPGPAPAPATAEEENRRYQDIINNIQSALEKLEKSSFFAEFMKQIDQEIAAEIERVIATDPQYSKLQLVLYGVGEMERSDYTADVEICHLQLALAILLKEKFQWVSDIVVFDPIMSPLQQKAISAFNCTFLPVNEYGRRTVDRPTLFFMPRCPTDLFNNVLSANWTSANLNKIIILGYSFRATKEDIDHCLYLRSLKHLMAILHSDNSNIMLEMPLPEPEISLYKTGFGKFSWHFFPSDGSVEDLNLNLYPEFKLRSRFVA